MLQSMGSQGVGHDLVTWLSNKSPQHHIFSIHSSVHRRLSQFHLALVNSAATNMGVQTVVWVPVSVLLGIDLGVELLDHMVILLKFLRKCHTIFHSGSITLYPHKDYCIYVHQWYWPVISFFFFSVISFAGFGFTVVLAWWNEIQSITSIFLE